MMFGMAAATSALDLIKTLTNSQSATKPASKSGFSVGAQESASTASTPSQGQASLISPDTMNALFAAQSQNETSQSSRSDALKSLFSQIDGDADGQISKTEFENALGAGGTNVANADKVFGKLDTDGDGNVSMAELAAALKPKKRAHGPQPHQQDTLLQALDGTNATTATNTDGTKVTSSPIALSEAARSYNAVSRMNPQLVDMLTKKTNASAALSVSV